MSFLIDPFLLVISGIIELLLIRKILYKYSDMKKTLWVLSIVIILCFWLIAGALYLDIIDMFFLGEFGRGNHFMWNSGCELIGLSPFIDTTIPTYLDFFNPLNLFAICLFAIYPLWLYVGVRIGQKFLD